MNDKTCSKCKANYPATKEHFPPNKRCNDGLHSWCRVCHRAGIKACQQSDHGRSVRQRINRKYRSTIEGHLRIVYSDMTRRCTRPENNDYKYYGERGIKNLFESSGAFVDYVINVLKIDPRDKQIHRIDNGSHYQPGNVEFLTSKEHRKRHTAGLLMGS